MPNESDGNKPSHDSQGQPSGQSPAVPTTPPESKIGTDSNKKPDSDQATAKELAREFRWVEFAQLAVNGALAVIGIIALLIYHGQLDVMRGQLGEIIRQFPEIQKSANAAKSAADTADATLKTQQKSFEIDQRPYLVGQTPVFSGLPFAANTSIHVNLTYKNIGRTPAIRTFTNIRFSKYRSVKASKTVQRDALRKLVADRFRQMRKEESRFRKELSRFPEGADDIAPGADSFTSNPGDDVILTTNEFAEIQTQDTYIFLLLVGLLTYTDAFGNPYETEFCWFYAGSDPRTWHKCQGYSRIR